MLPQSDGLTARRVPIVNVAIIVANFAVWIFYELPHLQSSIFHASFYPCTVNGSCHGPEPWGISWIFGASANGGGVAFFAHVGGFLFGVIVTSILTGAGRISVSADSVAPA